MKHTAKTADELFASMKPSIVMQEDIGPVDMTIRLKMTTTDHDFDVAKVASAIQSFRTAIVGSVIVKDTVTL